MVYLAAKYLQTIADIFLFLSILGWGGLAYAYGSIYSMTVIHMFTVWRIYIIL
jgi:hypothetical protein